VQSSPTAPRAFVKSPGNEQIAADETLRLHAPLAAVRPKFAPTMRMIRLAHEFDKNLASLRLSWRLGGPPAA
jgi:hypothetical protein